MKPGAVADSNDLLAWPRRSFMASLGAGLGALALRPACLRAGPKRSEISFVVVSDTHLGYKDQPKAGELWRKTAAEIERTAGSFVLHLGDIVDRGVEAQYPLYLESRQQITKPVFEIPGNHDPQPLFAKYIRPTVDYAFDQRWLRFLLLNNAHTDSHDGFITAEQLQWLDQQCADAGQRGLFVMIAMHVPAHDNRHPDRGWHVKPASGQSEFYRLMAKHRDRVVALLHGHFHNGLRGWDDHQGLHEICFPSALYNLDRKLQEQRAPGYNPLEFRPGYTLVRLHDGLLDLQYQPTGAEASVTRSNKIGPGA